MKLLNVLFFNLRSFALILSITVLFAACKKDEEPIEPEPPVIEVNELGTFKMNPSDMILNETQQIRILFTANPKASIIEESVALFLGEEEIVALLDDGDLQNGDEIKGDNVFSAIFEYTASEIGIFEFEVAADVNKDDGAIENIRTEAVEVGVYADVPDEFFVNLYTFKDQMLDKFNEYLNGDYANLNNAYTQLVDWVGQQDGISSAVASGNSNFQIIWDNGLKSTVFVSPQDENGTSLTRGGIPSENDRASTAKVALQNQTRGQNLPLSNYKVSQLEDWEIGNRNVYVYSSAEDEFAPYIERPSVEDILFNAECGEFGVASLVNQQATVNALYAMPDFGTVLISSHGARGEIFTTGEIVDTVTVNLTQKALYNADKLEASWKVVVNQQTGQAIDIGWVWSATYKLIQDIGPFPNTLVINNSCESTMSDKLSNAFITNGAKAYVGYDKVVNSNYCVTTAIDMFTNLVVDGLGIGSTSKIFTGDTDPLEPYAQIQLVGNTELSYSLTFQNGHFEDLLDYWTYIGDGRVISQLGQIQPYEDEIMGIISTGLGYTTSSGELSQTFIVPFDAETLHMTWNFLSEEFLDYIGSQFQDRFEVVMKVEDVEHVLLSTSIDAIAAEYGATPEEAGGLIAVSPGVIFDIGDVYMTGKKESSFDLIPFRSKCATLILRCTDVGDSVFDTAILLDSMWVEVEE